MTGSRLWRRSCSWRRASSCSWQNSESHTALQKSCWATRKSDSKLLLPCMHANASSVSCSVRMLLCELLQSLHLMQSMSVQSQVKPLVLLVWLMEVAS